MVTACNVAAVTTETPPPRLPREAVIELAGLLLLLVGCADVVVAAWSWDWRAGLGVLGASAALAGWRLATREVD